MRVLLFSMPDGTHPLFPRFCRPPNLGLASLAGNLKEEADVTVADLILKRENVPAAIREALEKVRPDVVGLSCMTFQYDTAKRVAAEIRSWNPDVPIALGGYHPSMTYRQIGEQDTHRFDFICRGESEVTLRELVVTLKRGDQDFGPILGLSWRQGGSFHHNPERPISPLEQIMPPARGSRLWGGYHIHGRRFDHAESSRGCTLPCNFCSITKMYGRNFRPYPLDRILDDLTEAARLGTQEIFFVDDNITLKPGHLEQLCDGIIERRLNRVLEFSTQASVAGLYRDIRVVQKMAEAGFVLVFLGIENVSKRNLLNYKKGNIVELAREVIRELRKNKIMIMGGFVLGSPDDSEEDLLDQFAFMRKQALDSYLVQILTPYPNVPLTADLEQQGMVVNPDFRRYSGLFANVRTKHLSSYDLDFLRWKHFPYYRDLRWFLNAVAPRRFTWGVFKETLIRFGEWLTEKCRKFLVSEEYAFRKQMKKQIASNLFFGESPEVTWPDRVAPAEARFPQLALDSVRKLY